MRIKGLVRAVGAGVLLAGALLNGADDEDSEHRRGCSLATLRGAYGIQIQGTRPVPPPAPAGTMESVIGVTFRRYDGQGAFTQVSNDKGSVRGNTSVDLEGAGTYEVNEDCTGSHEFQIVGSPITVKDRFVIVDRGREVRNFVVSPVPVMVTGVSQKIGFR